MDRNKKLARQRNRRRGHVRRSVRGTGQRPRLTVFRSAKHIYAQLIDDDEGRTLAAASTVRKGVVNGESTASKAAAEKVGQALAKDAKGIGVTRICFDRGHYKYHGKVAALAKALREGGLSF